MNHIPPKLREEMSEDPYYEICSRLGKDCSGRITWEHCFTYKGRQIQEKWAIIPLCVYHHLGYGLVKSINRAISVRRATQEERKKYPLVDYGFYERLSVGVDRTGIVC